MIRTPVESSSIRAVGYEPDTETLEIEFASGAVYNYAGVTQFAYDKLMAAESKGVHFATFVRPCFEATRLHDKGCRESNTCWCKRQRRDVSRAKEIENAAKEDLTPKLKASIKQARKRRAAV